MNKTVDGNVAEKYWTPNVWHKKYQENTGEVAISVCMDTLDWKSTDGTTCDKLSQCNIVTEQPIDGADLDAVGNDPASNCCACGKRFQGFQTASTPDSKNGAFCESDNGITCLGA